MIIAVSKTGTGTDLDPIRPDTSSAWWQVVEERPTEFVIEIIEE